MTLAVDADDEHGIGLATREHQLCLGRRQSPASLCYDLLVHPVKLSLIRLVVAHSAVSKKQKQKLAALLGVPATTASTTAGRQSSDGSNNDDDDDDDDDDEDEEEEDRRLCHIHGRRRRHRRNSCLSGADAKCQGATLQMHAQNGDVSVGSKKSVTISPRRDSLRAAAISNFLTSHFESSKRRGGGKARRHSNPETRMVAGGGGKEVDSISATAAADAACTKKSGKTRTDVISTTTSLLGATSHRVAKLFRSLSPNRTREVHNRRGLSKGRVGADERWYNTRGEQLHVMSTRQERVAIPVESSTAARADDILGGAPSGAAADQDPSLEVKVKRNSELILEADSGGGFVQSVDCTDDEWRRGSLATTAEMTADEAGTGDASIEIVASPPIAAATAAAAAGTARRKSILRRNLSDSEVSSTENGGKGEGEPSSQHSVLSPLASFLKEGRDPKHRCHHTRLEPGEACSSSARVQSLLYAELTNTNPDSTSSSSCSSSSSSPTSSSQGYDRTKKRVSFDGSPDTVHYLYYGNGGRDASGSSSGSRGSNGSNSSNNSNNNSGSSSGGRSGRSGSGSSGSSGPRGSGRRRYKSDEESSRRRRTLVHVNYCITPLALRTESASDAWSAVYSTPPPQQRSFFSWHATGMLRPISETGTTSTGSGDRRRNSVALESGQLSLEDESNTVATVSSSPVRWVMRAA